MYRRAKGVQTDRTTDRQTRLKDRVNCRGALLLKIYKKICWPIEIVCNIGARNLKKIYFLYF